MAEGLPASERANFDSEVRQLTAERLDIALLLGAIGLGGFSALDLVAAPHRFTDLLGIRVAALIGLGVIYLLNRHDDKRQAIDVLGVVSFIWMSVAVQALIMATGGHASSYYAGLNLILVGVAILIPWHWSRSLIVFLGIALVYDGTVLLLEWGSLSQLETFVTNNFFIAFTGVIMVAGTWATNVVRYSEFLARRRLDGANRELRELDQFRKDFIANLSHEMRTPLTLALAPVETLLEDTRRTDQEAELLRVIQTNALSLLHLIEDLLRLQRIDASMERLGPEEIQAPELFETLSKMAGPYAKRKDVTLIVEGAPEMTIVADREKLDRVLMNLLSNALKFTPPDGRIYLSCDDLGDSVLFTVADTGPGIAPEEREHVFQRFRQAERGTTRKYGGTGIGLSLVRELVEMHGGAVWIEGNPDGGTIVHVRLKKTLDHLPSDRFDRRRKNSRSSVRRAAERGVAPFTETIKKRDDYRMIELANASERRAGIRTDNARNRGRIMVVDDNADVLKILSVQLYGVHQVIHARSGQEALELTKKWHPSMIITDLMMPVMDGAELCRTLGENPETANIPVVLLTARADPEARVVARKSGAIAYLTKPWTRAELLATIDALLKKREESERAVAGYETRSTAFFAEGIAHELRNPLGFVVNAQFLMEQIADQAIEMSGIEGDERDTLISTLREAKASGEQGIHRIRSMIESVAALGETGGESGEADPAQIAAEIRQLVRPKLGDKKLIIDVAPASVRMNPGRMHQVILNLVKNAIEAVGTLGQVEIHGQADQGRYLLIVSDDGPGIPAVSRDEIFQPFFTTKSPGEGTGLGLAVSRRMVVQAQGELTLLETPAGTSFQMRLPLAGVARASTGVDSSSYQGDEVADSVRL